VRPLWLLLVLAACEHEGDMWRAPQVGDRAHAIVTYTSELTGPDGRDHHGTSVTDVISEVLAVSGSEVTKVRLAFLHDVHVFDGTLRRAASGAFEIERTDGEPTIVKVGGTVSPAEREYLTGFAPRHGTAAGVRRLLARHLKPGDVFQAEPAEITALGLDAGSLEVTVEDFDSNRVTLQLTAHYAGPPTTIAHGTLRASTHDHHKVIDAEPTFNGRVVGHMHAETHVVTW
jgi:hypothetical protein